MGSGIRNIAGFVLGLLGWSRVRSVLLLGGNKSVDKGNKSKFESKANSLGIAVLEKSIHRTIP